jgi:hypothetical protein
MPNKGYAHPLAIKAEADLRPALERRDKYLNTWLNTYVPSYNDEDDKLYTHGGVALPAGTRPDGDDDVISMRYLRSTLWSTLNREVRYTSGNWYAWPKAVATNIESTAAGRIYMSPITIGGVGGQSFSDFGWANTGNITDSGARAAIYYPDKDGLPGDMVEYSEIEYSGATGVRRTQAFAIPDPLTDALVLQPGVYWVGFMVDAVISWTTTSDVTGGDNYEQWDGGDSDWDTVASSADQGRGVYYYYASTYAAGMPDPFPSASLWSEVAVNERFRFGLKAA